MSQRAYLWTTHRQIFFVSTGSGLLFLHVAEHDFAGVTGQNSLLTNMLSPAQVGVLRALFTGCPQAAFVPGGGLGLA